MTEDNFNDSKGINSQILKTGAHGMQQSTKHRCSPKRTFSNKQFSLTDTISIKIS